MYLLVKLKWLSGRSLLCHSVSFLIVTVPFDSFVSKQHPSHGCNRRCELPESVSVMMAEGARVFGRQLCLSAVQDSTSARVSMLECRE